MSLNLHELVQQFTLILLIIAVNILAYSLAHSIIIQRRFQKI